MGLFLPGSFVRRQAWLEMQAKHRRRHELKRHATETIQRAYKEHLFTVDVDEHGNVAIDHPLMRHAKGRMFLPAFAYSDERLLKMCGEVLERANVKRGELLHYEEYDVADPIAKTAFSSR